VPRTWNTAALTILLFGGAFLSAQPDDKKEPSPPGKTPEVKKDPSPSGKTPEVKKDRPAEGKLKVGDIAPDFKLRAMIGKGETQLSVFKDKKPVVLVFGSYT
jgi:hypothetical protein